MAHGWLLGTVVFGLAASLSWGSGDFSGGLASRKAHVFSVVVAVYIAGLVLLSILALASAEPLPSWRDVLWGASAGLAGTVGLTAFYRALAIGRMGINAPITAVLAAAVPVIFSALYQGLPGPLQLAGFVLALLAVALISRPEKASGRPEGLGLALLAGLGFGGFLVLIGQVSAHAIFWPLTAARVTSLLFMLVFVRLMGQPLLPRKSVFPLIILAGALDVAGNVFFVLATHAGRLDVAAILSSLYPAVTVILAAIVLKERVSRIQTIGILMALLAILLISA
ncbi:MAG TPA: EamA family transporter [Ktedonobacteraceae bacterium]|nr:EamA family transporter [Ktedonobacteraceae bacterium]